MSKSRSKSKPAPSAEAETQPDSQSDPHAGLWDAYLTQIDGKPASVLVNLAFSAGEAPEGGAYLHQWALPMGDAGRQGLGSVEEARGFESVEEELTEQLSNLGFVPVGRERCDGHWKLSYYAQTEREDEMRAQIDKVFGQVGQRVVTACVPDDSWSYYFDLLCPDAQQLQWMSDRDQLLALRKAGASLNERSVEHFCYFGSQEGAEVFSNEARARGFECEMAKSSDPEAEYGWMVGATRVDKLELAELHVVVMTLFALAEDCGGAYDEWELESE